MTLQHSTRRHFTPIDQIHFTRGGTILFRLTRTTTSNQRQLIYLPNGVKGVRHSILPVNASHIDRALRRKGITLKATPRDHLRTNPKHLTRPSGGVTRAIGTHNNFNLIRRSVPPRYGVLGDYWLLAPSGGVPPTPEVRKRFEVVLGGFAGEKKQRGT